MSDADPTDGPLDPAREDAVRRLLAEARHDQPLPPEVAARLDVLIGRLAEERARESGVGSLSAQREKRSRRRGLLLVAAAAAVVAVAVPHVGRLGSSGDDTASSSADSAGSAASSEQERAASQSPFANQDQDAPEAAGQPAPPLVLTSAGFDAQVRRALLGSPPAPAAADSAIARLTGDCALPRGISQAYLYPATYDGQAALLTATPQSFGEQSAELYLCGESKPVRRVTIELPR